MAGEGRGVGVLVVCTVGEGGVLVVCTVGEVSSYIPLSPRVRCYKALEIENCLNNNIGPDTHGHPAQQEHKKLGTVSGLGLPAKCKVFFEKKSSFRKIRKNCYSFRTV